MRRPDPFSDVGLSLQGQDNLIHHPPQVPPDLRGRKAQNPEACPHSNPVTNEVVLRLDVVGMLEPIDFNYEPSRKAGEI